MGDPVRDVEEKLPGLRFHLVSANLVSSRGGVAIGTVHLKCRVEDVPMWGRAVRALDGLKLFSAMEEEIRGALGDALTEQQVTINGKDALIAEMQLALEEKDEEITKLGGVLSRLGKDLGLG